MSKKKPTVKVMDKVRAGSKSTKAKQAAREEARVKARAETGAAVRDMAQALEEAGKAFESVHRALEDLARRVEVIECVTVIHQGAMHLLGAVVEAQQGTGPMSAADFQSIVEAHEERAGKARLARASTNPGDPTPTTPAMALIEGVKAALVKAVTARVTPAQAPTTDTPGATDDTEPSADEVAASRATLRLVPGEAPGG